MPQPRGISERGTEVVVASNEVIATELRLFKEELSRRFDEQRDLGGRQSEALALELRQLRTDMTSNYVSHQAYQAEYGRVTDRIANVEGDVVEMRTSLATQFVDVHGHIDRRFEEITAAIKARFDETKDQRRWTWGQVVLIGLGVLAAATTVAVALISR